MASEKIPHPENPDYSLGPLEITFGEAATIAGFTGAIAIIATAWTETLHSNAALAPGAAAAMVLLAALAPNQAR